MKDIKYETSCEPMVVSKSIMDRFLQTENYSELLSLYLFYYYTAKWQETNTPKATNSYVAKGIGWSESKVCRFKKHLIDMELIENIKRVGDDGKVKGWYILVRFVWSGAKNHLVTRPGGGQNQGVENKVPNALNDGSLNALNNNKKNTITIGEDLSEEQYTFDEFWNDYDKKLDKQSCIRLFKKISKSDRLAIKDYIPQYKDAQPDKQFRKNPQTFLRNRSWEDEIIKREAVTPVFKKTKMLDKNGNDMGTLGVDYVVTTTPDGITFGTKI